MPQRSKAAKHDEAGPVIKALSRYIAGAIGRRLPAEVAEAAKHHLLDTIAAMISGAHLIPGSFAIRYARAQGGFPEATVLGSDLVTNAVNAALANGMLAHADETDDSHPASITHPGCAVVPAALAMAEREGRDGNELLRAVTLGYDITARTLLSLGVQEIRSSHRSTHAIGGVFGAAAAAGSLADLTPQQVRYLLSYTVQQASGVHCWARDESHVEKSFDFGGMPARNGVTAATMVALGMTGVEDALSGNRNFFSAFSRTGKPALLVEGLGKRFEIVQTNIKKWSVGSPIQSVLDALEILIHEHRLQAAEMAAIEIMLPEEQVWVVDNRSMPDICAQHLAAIMLLDGGLSFAAAHDAGRMRDPAAIALRRKITLVGSADLAQARPRRQAIVTIETRDGRTLRHHTRIVRGTADDAMSRQEVAAKALDLMAPVLGTRKSRRLIERIWAIEQVENVRRLRRLFQPAATA